MGHQALGPIPRTRSWQEVVALVEHGADVPQIANAAIRAAEAGLVTIAKDRGAVEVVWLLTELPHAARAANFQGALLECGIQAPRDPGLHDLVAAFCRAVDDRLPNNQGRTDLGEMAQMAAVETLVGTLGRQPDLFDVSPEQVCRSLARMNTVVQFGRLARAFFGRFVFKALDYYLSRVLPAQVGGGRRFATLAQLAAFTGALENHCLEAALIVERFCGEWTSAKRWERGRIEREDARDLAHGAVCKLIKELKVGAGMAEDGEEGRPGHGR
jgi:hypothetical protein